MTLVDHERPPAIDLGKDAGTTTLPSEGVFARAHDGSFFEFDGSLNQVSFDAMLAWAGDRKASDITIQTNEPVLAEIGGKNVPITRRAIRQAEIDMVVRYVYGEHGPGMLKAAHDLDPSHEVRMRDGSGQRRYRVNITAIRVIGGDGVQITIRTLPVTPIRLEKLGIEDDIVRNLRPNQGMVLVTGPTGSGKSTLLASIIRHIIEPEDANEKVLEYSSPIEYVYDGVDHPSSSIAQTEVGKHLIPYNIAGDERSNESLYAHAVRNALRRKPTIILVGETRDRATMQASVEAALTGHLLYSTMHSVGVPATLRRVLQFFPGDLRESAGIDVMETLRMCVTQLLFDRVGGGKVGLREYMVFDDRTRAVFMKRPTEEWPLLARQLMEAKRVTSKRMVESGWEAYEAGLISRDTYRRITIADRDQG